MANFPTVSFFVPLEHKLNEKEIKRKLKSNHTHLIN